MKYNKKGQLNMLLTAAIMIIIIVVVIGLGGGILGSMQDQYGHAGANSSDWPNIMNNTTQLGSKTLNDMGQYLPTVGLVVVIAVLLGLLLTYLYQRFVK